MVCYHFKGFQWKSHERQINQLFSEINPAHKYRSNFYRFNEKILGILYYYAIAQIGRPGDTYNVIACHETCIDIWEVFKTLNKMSYGSGYKINPSANIRKIEHLLKIADYVAGANRKIDSFKLETIGRHTILNDPIRINDLKYIFKIN